MKISLKSLLIKSKCELKNCNVYEKNMLRIIDKNEQYSL